MRNGGKCRSVKTKSCFPTGAYKALLSADYLDELISINQNEETPKSSNQQKAVQRELGNKQVEDFKGILGFNSF